MKSRFVTTGMNPFTREPIEFARFARFPEFEVDPTTTGIRLVPTDATPRKSHFLGRPLMSTGAEWPRGPNGPLDFLACVDFSEVHPEYARREGLPTSGILNVFYDQRGGDWSFEPTGPQYWRVLYVVDEAFELAAPVAVKAPVGIVFDGSPLADHESPRHRLGGTPNWIQRDGRPFLELVSGRYCRDAAVVDELRRAGVVPEVLRTSSHHVLLAAAKALDAAGVDSTLFQSGIEEWRLLLQLDCDSSLSFEWGDGGTLFVMIPTPSLVARRFEEAWIAWQCF